MVVFIPCFWLLYNTYITLPAEDILAQDESYGDSTQLLYLRARYYNPADGRFMSRDTWGGSLKQPMSYNSWLYTYGNPINYTDSTGLITEKNSEAARNIVNDLKTYNVLITVDWAYQYTNWLHTTKCGWNEGGWIMPDLKAIQAAVHIMDNGVNYLGGNFKTLIGKVVYVSEKGGNDGKGDPADNLADTHTGATHWRMPNWYSEETRLWVAVHEMGHIVAFREQPQMMDYYMGELGATCSNQPANRIGYYCNENQQPGVIYDEGPFAGTNNANMPSAYPQKEVMKILLKRGERL